MRCGRILSHIMDHDEDICVLDGDLADSNGAIFVHQRHPERFIMAGIAEQSMVSVAAGLAQVGAKPWVFSFAAFLCYRAYDQIRIGLSQGITNVKLVGSHAGGFTGRNGQTHAAINDIAVMASLPHMTIWSPACPADLKFAIEQMNADPSPAYLRLPREPLTDLPAVDKEWYWLAPPQDINVLATGITVHIALMVKESMQQLGISIGVLNVNKIMPLSPQLVNEINAIGKPLVVIEDHYRVGGLESILYAAGVTCDIHEKGWSMTFTGESGDFADILEAGDLNPSRIANEISTII